MSQYQCEYSFFYMGVVGWFVLRMEYIDTLCYKMCDTGYWNELESVPLLSLEQSKIFLIVIENVISFGSWKSEKWFNRITEKVFKAVNEYGPKESFTITLSLIFLLWFCSVMFELWLIYLKYNLFRSKKDHNRLHEYQRERLSEYE